MLRVNKVAALGGAIAAALSTYPWPMEAQLFNNQPVGGVEPETSTFIGAYEHAKVALRSFDQAMRVVANIEALNELNQRVEDSGLWLVMPLEADPGEVVSDLASAPPSKGELSLGTGESAPAGSAGEPVLGTGTGESGPDAGAGDQSPDSGAGDPPPDGGTGDQSPSAVSAEGTSSPAPNAQGSASDPGPATQPKAIQGKRGKA